MSLLQGGDISRVVLCPSNPFVSVDPILQVPGLWMALRESTAPVIVVSPIVGGEAIKGPTAKMMAELDIPVTALGVAQHYVRRYPGLVDYFVIDELDAKLVPAISDLGVKVTVTATVMKSREDKQSLASHVLGLGEER
jgi:LPPG:FO 2-phospho-L-lactate transferase